MDQWKLRPARDHELPPSERLRSLKRESGLFSTALHLGWWSMVRGYLAMWHRVSVIGAEQIPANPPYVLVANHTSHLDALVLAAPLPWRHRDRIFPIAAGDTFFETRVSSAFAAWMVNALPIWRQKCGSHALDDLRQRLLDEPAAYILFPEGTRSRTGTLLPFKPGLGMLVAQTSVPVVPCHLDGCFQCMTPHQRIPRPRRIQMRVGAPITFEGIANDREGWRHIAATMEMSVRNLARGEASIDRDGPVGEGR